MYWSKIDQAAEEYILRVYGVEAKYKVKEYLDFVAGAKTVLEWLDKNSYSFTPCNCIKNQSEQSKD